MYVSDASSNVEIVLDRMQGVYAAYRYDPFGTLLAKRGATQPFGFSTKRTDPATGLVYFGARWYAPHLGRWTSRDPLGEDGGLNLYAYVGNNPVNWVDPWGEMELPVNPNDVNPNDWFLDKRHYNPNNPNELKYIDVDGRKLEWHPGRPSDPSPNQQVDHWHDRQNFGNKHLKPGTKIPDPSGSRPLPMKRPSLLPAILSIPARMFIPIIINPCAIRPWLPWCPPNPYNDYLTCPTA